MVSQKHFQAQYQKFSFLLLFSVFSPLIISGIINIVIDPYGVFAFPEIKKINNIKPEKENLGRLYKAFDIRRHKPQVILLGSSRVETALEPEHPGFDKSLSVYNSAFQAGNTYEIMRYLEYAINQQPELKQVIIGLDFFMFNQYLVNRDTFSELRLQEQYPLQDILNSSLSIDALNSSKKTFIASVTNQKRKRMSETMTRFKFWLKGFLGNEELYQKYSLSSERMENFQRIIDICRENNIDIKIFISPTHATQYEAIEVAGLWSTFEQWKREIVKITPVWDFATYNSITTESISDNMVNYIDNSHYSQYTGNLILNKILSYQSETVPSDFGVFVTSDNIESHLIKIRDERQQWQKDHPEEVKLVHQLKAELNSK
ncbi:MAG: hypothetical protein QNJ32_17725 [Xenococcaceae cyanobacterium MO_167.B27]|nr:hypothetical protein [Xenococcaceae cyanobacterium MO_167.B27]